MAQNTPPQPLPQGEGLSKAKSPALAEGDLGGGLLNENSQNAQSPALAKLEKEFTKNAVQWREFLIGRLFEKVEYTKLNLKKQSLPKEQKGEYNLPAITCTTQNNGISCYVPRDNATIFKNCISVAANGDAPAFYQPHDFTILQDAYVLKFKDKELSHLHYLYLVALLQKVLAKFDWTNKSGWEKVKLEKITLPMDSNGEIAFDFMQSYIKELENERVLELENEQKRELKAYLQVTGLKDYELNEDEKAALKAFESLENSHQKSPSPCGFGGGLFNENSQNSHHENLKWREFKIGELFDIRPTKNYGLTNIDLFKTKGNTPVVVNSSLQNGVGGYVDLEPTEKGNMITYSDTTTSDSIFYQPRDFIGYSHIQGLYAFDEIWQKHSLLFFVALFRVATYNRFDFANKFNRKIAKEIKIKLPTKNGEIDFDFMRVFIKAIEKEVIKGVVLYSTKRLTATKQIIQKPTPNNENKKAK